AGWGHLPDTSEESQGRRVTACETERFNQEDPPSNREERIVRRPCGGHAQGCVSLDRCDITDGQMRKGSRISGIGQNLYFSGPLCVLQGLGRPGYGQIERSLADSDPAGEGERRDRRPVTDNVSTERAYHRARLVGFAAPEQSSRKRACGSYAPVLIMGRLGCRNG